MPLYYSDPTSEALALVCQYLSKTELQRLRGVNRTCKTYIDETYGIETLIVSRENWEWTQNAPAAVRTVIFHDFTLRFPSSVPYILNLREITFHRILLTNNLIAILQKCFQVEKLSFSRIHLDREEMILPPYPLRLPHLKTLQIHTPRDTGITLDYVILTRFLSEIDFGKLEEFNFFCQNEEVGNLASHWKRSTPILEFDASRISTWVTQIIRKAQAEGSLRSATMGYHAIPLRLSFYPNLLNRDHVGKPIQFQGIQSAGDIPASWQFAVSGQYYLQTMEIRQKAFEIWRACFQAIQLSSDVLSSVTLVDETSEEKKEIDIGAAFGACNLLTNLTVRFKECVFRNAEYLPSSLKVLKLRGMVSQKQFAGLATKLTNLEILEVDNCEEVGSSLGVSFKNGTLNKNPGVENVTMNLQTFESLAMLPELKDMLLINCSIHWTPILNWCHNNGSHEIKFHKIPINRTPAYFSARKIK